MQEVPSLDESKIIVNEIRKTSNLARVGDNRTVKCYVGFRVGASQG